MAYLGRTRDFSMYYGASKEMILKARALRQNMTRAEKVLWERLRKKRPDGHKFRNQHPIDIFIADFYCHECRLIIEVDGGIHDVPEIRDKDQGRTDELENLGLKILRFTNEEVIYQTDKVVDIIKQHLRERSTG